MNALHDDKSAKQVNLRLAAGEITVVESQCEIFVDHVTLPMRPLGRVIRKLQLTSIWIQRKPDFELCQQGWYSVWLNAVSNQRGYAILRSRSALDAEACLTDAV